MRGRAGRHDPPGPCAYGLALAAFLIRRHRMLIAFEVAYDLGECGLPDAAARAARLAGELRGTTDAMRGIA